jgi:hypothetical protein
MSLERYAKGLKQGFKVGYFSNQNASGLVHLHVSRLFKNGRGPTGAASP